MSFRGRLTLFFVLIVILPMVAVSVLVVQVTDDSRSGKADARLFAGLQTATSLYQQDSDEAADVAREIADDPSLAGPLESGEPGNMRKALSRLAGQNGVSYLVLRAPGGERVAVGRGEPVAAAQVRLQSQGGRELGTLTVSTTSAQEYLREVETLTARDAALLGGGRELASTLQGSDEVEVPGNQETAAVDVGGEELRAVSTRLPGPGNLELVLFGPVETGGFFASSPLIAVALAAFFGIAFLFVLMLTRTLQGQVGAMLDAARRIGGGDFSGKVPVIGSDEMAGLAAEFNKMSDRLSEQMDQLRRQQIEIDRSIRRIGDAFASGLDRAAMLKIVVETSLSACDAEYGLIAISGKDGAEAEAGNATKAIHDAVGAAEERARAAGELADERYDGAFAIAAPLSPLGEPDTNIGLMSVARADRPFTPAERDVFLYLIGQASSSIENVALHELVSEQAVTDDLTVLSNKRAFRDLAEKEAQRAARFGHQLSLLMLDIDDFKNVNDTYGHLQGDEVLRRIGRILDAESRGVDEPARYGGEEFVVALPETGPEGAEELAERVRVRIEAEEIPFVDRDGVLRVTASVGVASIPDSASDLESLIAAADAALYAAKRGGKNRVEQAPDRAPAR